MVIELKPETERLVREELQNGHFGSVEELIDRAVQVLHEQRGSKKSARRSPAEAIAHIREIRQGVTLAALRIKDLRDEGRP